MGFETANVHLGTAHARRSILKHLGEFSKNELKKAALITIAALLKDFRKWKVEA